MMMSSQSVAAHPGWEHPQSQLAWAFRHMQPSLCMQEGHALEMLPPIALPASCVVLAALPRKLMQVFGSTLAAWLQIHKNFSARSALVLERWCGFCSNSSARWVMQLPCSMLLPSTVMWRQIMSCSVGFDSVVQASRITCLIVLSQQTPQDDEIT